MEFLLGDHKQQPTCRPDEFPCSHPIPLPCIPLSGKCNHTWECFDGSDEENCPTTPAPPCAGDEFQCVPGHCIKDSLVCDKKKDCPDGSDEEPKQDCKIGQIFSFLVISNFYSLSDFNLKGFKLKI